jgi:hypothetical protein
MHGTSATAPAVPPPARRRSTTLALVAVGFLGALAVLASACGGGGPSSASSTAGGSPSRDAGSDAAQQAGLAYATCMRSHGISDFPDTAISSSAGGGVRANIPSSVAKEPGFPTAQQACQSKLPNGGNGNGTSGASGTTTAEIKLANCMHQHGVTSFPEPNAQGHTIVTGGSGLTPSSPTYQSAWAACKSLLPAGATPVGGGG